VVDLAEFVEQELIENVLKTRYALCIDDVDAFAYLLMRQRKTGIAHGVNRGIDSRFFIAMKSTSVLSRSKMTAFIMAFEVPASCQHSAVSIQLSAFS